ncbi:hypothetical protein DMN91_001614 [Ooceraea biroi]|uniref:EGF-like domain-containing protein n=1 Tax=Ooceraea biroi TaxID=2015173 RepID=A0A026W9X0_OOCBI|nr:uncharacterized protein LOC105281725 isoform X1 [Ooceraea biroi]EZA52763.1 hypothetical protein X777_07144 [Ooceraea biroi]RLU25458.1 hypothetical protein DMN91_001614 [Ooceraea biroi]
MKVGMGLQIIMSLLLAISIFSPPMSGALTTFGKTPQNQNQNPPPPPTPIGKARECKMESECAGIPNTTCIADPRDGRTRCLCGDYSAPLNGICTNKFKALRATCNSDSECIEDAYCIQRNSTLGKRCYCREGFYEEGPMSCDGCSSIFNVYTTSLLIASLVLGRFYI